MKAADRAVRDTALGHFADLVIDRRPVPMVLVPDSAEDRPSLHYIPFAADEIHLTEGEH